MSCHHLLCTFSSVALNKKVFTSFFGVLHVPWCAPQVGLHDDTITLGQGRRTSAEEELNPCLFTSRMSNTTGVAQGMSLYPRIYL